MLNENIREYRKQKGFSQEQLAVRLNVVRQTVSKWEKGLSVPDAELLAEMAEVLNVKVSDLLGQVSVTEEEDDSRQTIAEELAKLNELLALHSSQSKQFRKKVGEWVLIALLIALVCAVFPKWTAIFHEFGQNLYHMTH
ncbi:MAG: helix-turn-helix domain-containing protein [Acetatifactor sp.]|nr:helix-turn-helix domain-containing protein [Acetatifactor sp.]